MSPKLVVLIGLVVLAAVMVGVAQLTGGDGAKRGENDVKLHPLGAEVVVGHTDAEGDPGVMTRIGLTVLAVRTGTREELEPIGREDEDVTPYYIDARFANKGPNAVKRDLEVGLEDSRGKLILGTFIFGTRLRTFEPCRKVTEGTLEPGESYESCTLVLVPKGVDVAKVYFLSDNGPDTQREFVYWAIE